jgi:CelD/BcsL family acetyltransferase involved in cellulose biosynthesis
MKRDFDVEEITALERLEELRSEWAGLWSAALRSTPFQAPAWLIPWWRCFGSGELAVLALRERGRLVAVMAGAIRTTLETGESFFELIGGAISDYQDAVFAPGYEQAAARQALDWLERMTRERCDRCELEQLPDFSPLVSAPVTWPWFDEVKTAEVCPVLRLDTDELTGCLSTAQSAKLRYYRRRADRMGGVAFKLADESNWPELLDDLFELHRRSWHQRGQSGVLADAVVERFHRAVAPELLRAGVLRLNRMTIGGRAAAALYGLGHGERAYYYIGGFDPEFMSVSPGTLLIGHAIEGAIASGAKEFDFLRGREPYKYLWGAKDRLTYRRALHRRPPLRYVTGV